MLKYKKKLPGLIFLILIFFNRVIDTCFIFLRSHHISVKQSIILVFQIVNGTIHFQYNVTNPFNHYHVFFHFDQQKHQHLKYFLLEIKPFMQEEKQNMIMTDNQCSSSSRLVGRLIYERGFNFKQTLHLRVFTSIYVGVSV